MATTHFKDTSVHTVGELPEVGFAAPEFTLTGSDLRTVTLADLPFAAGRFCSAEGIEDVVTGSVFRSDFGTAYGVELADGPMQGLLARAVVVDAEGTVAYTELVPEITTEPDYEAALAVVRG